MSKNNILFSVLFLCLGVVTSFGQQKIGHINSGLMLEKMPEVITADTALAMLEDSLGVKLDTMMLSFRVKYDAAVKQVNEGTMTKIQQANIERELNDEQTAITEFQKNAQAIINLRRQQLLAPLLERLNKAISDVGKEQNYAFILDIGTGSLLFVEESDDVSNAVAAKLGL